MSVDASISSENPDITKFSFIPITVSSLIVKFPAHAVLCFNYNTYLRIYIQNIALNIANIDFFIRIQKKEVCRKANLLFLSYYLSLEILSHYLIRVIICGSCGNDPNHLSTLVPLNAAIQCVCYIAKLKIIISFYIITGCFNRYAVKR